MADVLPERSAERLTNGLVQHPGVEIITHDRSEIYAEGARRGAPEAVQVADRWHLLKNMGDLVERVLQRHHRELVCAAAESISLATTDADRQGESSAPPQELSSPDPSSTRTKSRLPRQLGYEQIHALRRAGRSIHAIRKTLHLSRPTVRNYLHAPSYPTRALRRTMVGGTLGLRQSQDRLWPLPETAGRGRAGASVHPPGGAPGGRAGRTGTPWSSLTVPRQYPASSAQTPLLASPPDGFRHRGFVTSYVTEKTKGPESL